MYYWLRECRYTKVGMRSKLVYEIVKKKNSANVNCTCKIEQTLCFRHIDNIAHLSNISYSKISFLESYTKSLYENCSREIFCINIFFPEATNSKQTLNYTTWWCFRTTPLSRYSISFHISIKYFEPSLTHPTPENLDLNKLECTSRKHASTQVPSFLAYFFFWFLKIPLSFQ